MEDIKKIFQDTIDELLTHNWSEEEIITIKKMIANMNTYKYLLSTSLKKDIIVMFQLAINVKTELEILRDKVTIIEKELHNSLE